MTISANDRITKNGKTLSRRHWALLADVSHETGIPIRVLQGSWSRGSRSAGTHGGSGAVDISVRGMTEKQAIAVVVALRRRNCAAWLRSPKYGWPSRLGGSHIHSILKDEPGLAYAARRQVINYNQGQNGLASRRKDPFPRPKQTRFGMHVVVPAKTRVKLANLRYGKKNQDVADLQRALHVVADGNYGPVTDAAVRKHQAKCGWTPDPKGKSSVGPHQAQRLGLVVF